ncbi:uncharacterized protein [Neodiprion pinetum]|uniref:uncharacterized protein n=1 Tax=Neodiprion pinetum TaxID=441929 RepID=UPI003719620A
MVAKLQRKGAIRQCDSTHGEFLSGIFRVPKPDGGSRFILNLKQLNEFIQTEHFKLEDRKTVINLLSRGCFMAKIDLKDAYYSISIAESNRKFLRFQFEGQLYEFTCMPFGLATAPYVFTKLLKPVMTDLRRQGYFSVIYIDDLLLVEFVGSVVSCCPAVRYGLGHTKAFERARYLALEQNKGNYDGYMTLSQDLHSDLKWWDRGTSSVMAADYPGGRNIIRKAFEIRNVPEESFELMLASLRNSSMKQYDGALRKWWSFCSDRNVSPFDNSIENVLLLLTNEYNKGASYGSLNCLRSALALILGPHVGQDPRVKRLFKGVSELRPPKPKYDETWDPKIVLDYAASLMPNEEISLNNLSLKVVTLLALVTGQRMQTLSLIKIPNIQNLGEKIQIKVPDKVKTSGPNRRQPLLNVPFYEKDNSICAATALVAYLKRTQDLRGAEQALFVAIKKPYGAVSAQTLSRCTTLLGCLLLENIFMFNNSPCFGAVMIFKHLQDDLEEEARNTIE